jgi:hypothetical protein
MGVDGRNVIPDLKRNADLLLKLSKMERPPEHDLMRNPNLTRDPEGEIAVIKDNLRRGLTNLKAVEVVIAELRANAEELLR